MYHNVFYTLKPYTIHISHPTVILQINVSRYVGRWNKSLIYCLWPHYTGYQKGAMRLTQRPKNPDLSRDHKHFNSFTFHFHTDTGNMHSSIWHLFLKSRQVLQTSELEADVGSVTVIPSLKTSRPVVGLWLFRYFQTLQQPFGFEEEIRRFLHQKQLAFDLKLNQPHINKSNIHLYQAIWNTSNWQDL